MSEISRKIECGLITEAAESCFRRFSHPKSQCHTKAQTRPTTTSEAFSAARRSGLRLDCQVEGSLPSHGQPQGLGLSCKCPHPLPEGEESRLHAGLGARSPAPRRFRVGRCPAGWSSQPYRAYHRLKQQKSSRALTRGREKSARPLSCN